MFCNQIERELSDGELWGNRLTYPDSYSDGNCRDQFSLLIWGQRLDKFNILEIYSNEHWTKIF